MNCALFIARRTALSSRRTDGSRASRSPAVGVAVTAVALSLTIMICAVAIVAGFKQQILDKISGFNAHLQIYRMVEAESVSPENYDNLITLTPTLKGILTDQDYITDYELEFTVPAVLKTENDFKGIYVKGAEGNMMNNFLSSQITQGSFPDFGKPQSEADIALSQKMASELGLAVDDSISTFYLHNDLIARRYRVAAIYTTHFEQFDELIAVGSIENLHKVCNIEKGKGVNLRIQTNDYNRIDEYAQRLQQRLNEAYLQREVNIPYRVESMNSRSASYLSWLNMLDTNVIVILSLMTVVACITLIAAMLILIIDKVRLIGILRALGATRRMVQRVFVFMALRIAFFGLLIGNIVGLSLCWIQHKWHLAPLAPDSYYIDFVPVKLDLEYIIILNAAVCAVVFGSLLLPSLVAGQISPAESMRYQE